MEWVWPVLDQRRTASHQGCRRRGPTGGDSRDAGKAGLGRLAPGAAVATVLRRLAQGAAVAPGLRRLAKGAAVGTVSGSSLGLAREAYHIIN